MGKALLSGLAAIAPCGTDGTCEAPRNRRREKLVLWLATALALILWSFTFWSTLLV